MEMAVEMSAILTFIPFTLSKIFFATVSSSIFCIPVPSTSQMPAWPMFQSPCCPETRNPKDSPKKGDTPKYLTYHGWPASKKASTVVTAIPALPAISLRFLSNWSMFTRLFAASSLLDILSISSGRTSSSAIFSCRTPQFTLVPLPPTNPTFSKPSFTTSSGKDTFFAKLNAKFASFKPMLPSLMKDSGASVTENTAKERNNFRNSHKKQVWRLFSLSFSLSRSLSLSLSLSFATYRR